MLGPDVQEAGAFWPAEPFVAVPAVEVGSELGEVEWYLRGRVCSVDDREKAQLASAGDDCLHRQDERRLRRHVAEIDGTRPLARGGEQRVGELARVAQR